MNTIKENLLRIQVEIEPYTPNIIAVTKYFDESKIIEAYQAGLRNFGESRIPEAIEKINRLPKEIQDNSSFHLIGHLQTNKVKKAVGFFDIIHSIDSLHLAQEVSKEALNKNLIQKVLLQVNNAQEEQKFGFSKQEIFDNFEQISSLRGIKILGLMNIAPLDADENELKNLFLDIASFRGELQKKYNCELKEMSMGMSNDYVKAVEAGATMVRIGRKLFK